eukprot:4137470-Heterocapsa_arctica.AAC.1
MSKSVVSGVRLRGPGIVNPSSGLTDTEPMARRPSIDPEAIARWRDDVPPEAGGSALLSTIVSKPINGVLPLLIDSETM